MADRKPRPASAAGVEVIAESRAVVLRAGPRRPGRSGRSAGQRGRRRPRDGAAPTPTRVTGAACAFDGFRPVTEDAVDVFPVREPAVAVGEECRAPRRTGDG
ncbi:hypothetical protein ACIHEJ_39960 [Streptomyces sp. NPDC052301]|uniref:hypothetical protein n=1 Tax=Streptomyces sp. NPDC052301 TaxID=3365687 RepID=UPI0037D547F0